MDVTKPLCRFQNIKGMDGRIIHVDIAYKRLSFFCFLCGTIGHSECDCSNVDDDNDQSQTMGWNKSLRATSRTRVQKMLEEVEEVKACRMVLFIPKSKVM